MPIADPEIRAISTFAAVLAKLDPPARGRVLRWCWERYGPYAETPEAPTGDAS